MSFDITRARAEYGTLLRISSSSGSFYFRLPSKAEFDNYNGILSNFNIPLMASNYLFEACLLYPKDIDIPVGELVPIVNVIVERSGFHDIKQFENIVKTYRTKADELGERVIATICKAFPGYLLEQVESMNAQQLARHLVMSEVILEQQTAIANESPKSKTEKLSSELSDKDKEQAQKLREISREALNQVKRR